jgi:predicted component of type VI protein secretion system
MDILLSIRSKADGAVREVKHEIGNGLVVGRGAERGVLLDGPDLSREHLVLTTDGTEIYVTDLSSNGTWLNGTRLRRSVRNRVRVEDSIELPGYVLTLKLDGQPEKVEKAEEVPVATAAPRPQPAAEPSQVVPIGAAVPVTTEPAGTMAFLNPVFGFVGSFTFLEKFMVLVALSGLLLLYAYVGA